VTAREERIAAEARALGFPLAGCAPLAPLPVGEFLARWIADGRAGDMAWLARRSDERLDPRRLVPWARSVICLAFPYAPPPSPPGDWRTTLRGRIAAYARGADYHDRIGDLLHRLADRLAALWPGSRFRGYVDTGPVLEREWAMRAGLGWIGKHTVVLHRALGSYFFLAELFTDLALDAVPLPADHCGGCTRCAAACPTGALGPAYTMDPRRCLAYLTIEHRGAIPVAFRPALENWIFGCDLCQEACPVNDREEPGGLAEFGASEEDAAFPDLVGLLALTEPEFRARFAGRPILRAKYAGLLRNACVALGNLGAPEAARPLARALEHPEALVRGHAAWALGRLGSFDPLRARLPREDDPWVRDEITVALGSAS
jgi:epoxyqueuosine reductase